MVLSFERNRCAFCDRIVSVKVPAPQKKTVRVDYFYGLRPLHILQRAFGKAPEVLRSLPSFPLVEKSRHPIYLFPFLLFEHTFYCLAKVSYCSSLQARQAPPTKLSARMTAEFLLSAICFAKVERVEELVGRVSPAFLICRADIFKLRVVNGTEPSRIN